MEQNHSYWKWWKDHKGLSALACIMLIVFLGVMFWGINNNNNNTKESFDVETEIRKQIETYVATSLRLNASINTQAHCYSVVIDGDTVTVYGNYTAIGSTTELGTFKGTCKIKLSDNNVFISNKENIIITKP